MTEAGPLELLSGEEEEERQEDIRLPGVKKGWQLCFHHFCSSVLLTDIGKTVVSPFRRYEFQTNKARNQDQVCPILSHW